MSKKDEKETKAIPAEEESTKVQPAKAEDDGKGWEFASAQIWTPSINDTLQGIYDGSEPFTEGTLDTEVSKHYVLDAEGRRFSFVGGSVFDKAINSAGIKAGMEVKITYLGKKDLAKDGKRVNLFEIKYRKRS